MNNPTWTVGQEAVIDRREIVRIERVTPTGRVVAGGRTFNPGGTEWRRWDQRKACLELLTAEVKAEIALVKRGNEASSEVARAINRSTKWLAVSSLYSFSGRSTTPTPDIADVEKAEALAAAINAVIAEEG